MNRAGNYRLFFGLTVCLLSVAVPGAVGLTEQPSASQAAASQPGQAITRTREQVEALIVQAGKSKPDWYDSVELKYPDTLDLTWSPGTGSQPDPARSLGAYINSVIGPNPGRYREGVKLLHRVVIVNQHDKKKLAQSMEALGTAYYDMLHDYPRAVFWWRQADRTTPGRFRHTIDYARCYYKMGCREMAVELIARIGHDNTFNAKIARLWAELGDAGKALDMAEVIAEDGRPDVGYLTAGDLCRQAGQYKRAIEYYQKVLATTETNSKSLEYHQERAMRNLEGVMILDALDLSRVKDGTYAGSEFGFIADIDVEVMIRKGRIESVKITHTEEDRPLTALTEMPDRIIAKQGVKGVDIVSGATVTSDAIINATGKALQGAMK